MTGLRSLWRDLAPIEHGSWGLFLIPLLLGAAVSRHCLGGQILLGLSTMGVFLMRRPALQWLRAFSREPLDAIHTLWPGRALACCLGLTLLTGIPLLWMGHVYLMTVSLLAAGLMWSEVYLGSSRKRHPFLSELVEVAVLCLLAPSAYYVGTGHLDAMAGVLWLLCAIYFSVSIADIRVRLARFRVLHGIADEALTDERKLERLVTLWVALAGALLVSLLAPQYRRALWSLAPLALRPFYRKNQPVSAPADISSLGWSEVSLSVLFAVLAGCLL